MAFQPEKCSAIRITRAWKPISSSYILKGHTLNMEDSTRYLGVELQSRMSWNRHMDQAVKKANSTVGFLWRNLRISNEQTKSAAYFSMVRPIIEYCSTVWSPPHQGVCQQSRNGAMTCSHICHQQVPQH